MSQNTRAPLSTMVRVSPNYWTWPADPSQPNFPLMIEMKPSRIFPGWWVVAGAFLCMVTGFAVAYSFAAFFGALESEFGARRSETSLVFSISAFLYFQLGFPAGLIADRIGPRPVVLGGLLLVAIGLVAAAQAGSLWEGFPCYRRRGRRGGRL